MKTYMFMTALTILEIVFASREEEHLNNSTSSIVIINKNHKKYLEISLKQLSRDTLLKYAFAVDSYHKKLNNRRRTSGGIHDYIWLINTDQIVKFILKETREHPEIGTKEKLDKLTFGLINDHIKIDTERILRGFLRKLKREKLENCAKAVEKYHLKFNHKNYSNHTHLDMKNLTDYDLIDLMVMELDNHPEIRDNFEMLCLNKMYTLNYQQNSKYYNNIHENLHYFNLPVLRIIAHTFAIHDNQNDFSTKNRKIKSINNHNREKLIMYLKKMISKYPEHNKWERFEQLKQIYKDHLK